MAATKHSRKTENRKPIKDGFKGLTDEEINALPTDEFADRTFADFGARKKLLTRKQLAEFEAGLNQHAENRRMALSLLTKPFSFIRKQVTSDKDFALAVASLYEGMEGLETYYRYLHEMMSEAHKRMTVALSYREDLDDILAKVKA